MNKPKLIGELRDLLSQSFASGMAKAAPKLGDGLFELAGKSADMERQRTILAARDLVLARAGDLSGEIRTDYLKRFRDKLSGEGAAFSKTVTFSLDSLSLVDDAEVQENILLGNIAGRLRETCSYELFALTKRLEFLTDRPAISDSESPLMPRVFCRTFLAALTALDATPQGRYDIFACAEPHLSTVLYATFKEANEFLVSHAVLIEIVQAYGRPIQRPSGPRRATEIAALQGGGVQDAPGDGGTGSAPAADNVVDMITRLLAQSGYTAGGGQPGGDITAGTAPMMPGGYAPAGGAGAPVGGAMPLPAGGAAPVASGGAAIAQLSPQVLEVLNRLAALQLQAPAPATDASPLAFAETVPMTAIRADTPATADMAALDLVPTNVVRQAREELSTTLEPAQGMITDVVAGFFDRIFEAPEISPGIKALIGRLQLQTLKASMENPAIFTDQGHPLRAFMDKLADLGVKRSTSLSRGDATFDQLSLIVENLSGHFDSDPGAVTRANRELDVLIESEEAHALEVVVDSVSKVQAEEQQEFAHSLASYDIARRLELASYPDTVRAFVNLHWQPLLAMDHLSHGDDSDERNADLATLDDLLWSVRPVETPEDRLKLLKLVPQLAGRLNDGLDRAGVATADRDAFFHFLANLHSVALRTPIKPGLLKKLVSKKPETKPAAEQLPLKPTATATAPASAPTPAPAPVVDPRAGMRKRSVNIERGQWIELRNDDGTIQRCRLSWISPLKETFVFKNYDNKQAMTLTTADFNEKLKAGDIKLLEDDSLTERSLAGAIKTVMDAAPPAEDKKTKP